MEKSSFTQNSIDSLEFGLSVAVALPDITAESAFEAAIDSFISKHPTASVSDDSVKYRGAVIREIQPANLAAFNELLDLLRDFEAAHPNIMIYNLP